MKRTTIIGVLAISLVFILSACKGVPEASAAAASSPIPTNPSATPPISTKPTNLPATLTSAKLPTDPPATPAAQKASPVPTNSPKGVATPDLTRTDSQGQVTVTVIPINLENPSDTLIFDVSMNTHSVNLTMDLSKLARLTADNGKSAQVAQWDGPSSGGHHVGGKLSFPAKEFSGAKKLTLTINNVDVPSRVFTWVLVQ
jgi:hypothetical protein